MKPSLKHYNLLDLIDVARLHGCQLLKVEREVGIAAKRDLEDFDVFDKPLIATRKVSRLQLTAQADRLLYRGRWYLFSTHKTFIHLLTTISALGFSLHAFR